MRSQGKFLINRNDPVFLSRMWIAKIHGLSTELDQSLIFGIYTGKDLDESRFPCSVLPHQPNDLTRINFEVYVYQCLNAGEVFGDLFQLQ